MERCASAVHPCARRGAHGGEENRGAVSRHAPGRALALMRRGLRSASANLRPGSLATSLGGIGSFQEPFREAKIYAAQTRPLGDTKSDGAAMFQSRQSYEKRSGYMTR